MPTKTKNITQRSVENISDGVKTVALRTYSKQKSQSENDVLIAEGLPMVQKIVQRVVAYLKPPLSREDLVSAGTIGLVKAARDYEPTHNAEFKTYAYIRIKGAILDELRSWSFVPSSHNKQIREVMELSQKIISKTGSVPSDERLAGELGMTIDKLYETLENARARHFLSIDGTVSGDDTLSLSSLLTAVDSSTPDKIIERTELIEKLAEAIRQLPEKQRQIILLYYQQDLTMKQTAEVFGITESRVSQLHASALFNLGLKLRQWKDGG